MHLDHVRALLDVLSHGSFLAASRATGVPRGTLRTRVEALEEALGTPLLVRTNDGALLSDAGRLALPHLRTIVAQDLDLRRELDLMAMGRIGEISMAVPEGAPPAGSAIAIAIARAALSGASIRMEAYADPLRDAPVETDLVLHLGEAPEDPRWFSRVIRRVRLVLIASPDYLARAGTPASVDALDRHPILLFQGPCWTHTAVPLATGGLHPVQPAFRSSDIDLLRWMAALGQGIACTVEGDVPETPGRPAVVPVLPEEVHLEVALRASTRHRSLPRIQRLLDAFDTAMGTFGEP